MFYQNQGHSSRGPRPVVDDLTTAEWKLIARAVSAYQHNPEFRSLYEKLQACEGRLLPADSERRD